MAPGFIDLHQHGQSQDAYRLLALDGVTTALELEVGVPDIQRFIEARRERSPIHFGAAASHLAARLRAWDVPLPVSIFGPEGGIIPQSGPDGTFRGQNRQAARTAQLSLQLEF